MKYLTDEEIIKTLQQKEKVSDGDWLAFYNRHNRSIMRYLTNEYSSLQKAEIENISQEAFIKIMNKLGTVKNPKAVNSWIKTIVIREGLNYFRKIKATMKGAIEDEYEEKQISKNIEESYDCVELALEALKQEKKKVADFVNDLINNFTNKDLQKKYSIKTDGAVRQRKTDYKKILTEYLNKFC